MKFQKRPIALATFALFATAPFAAHAVTVSFQQPTVNEVLGNVSYLNNSQCQVSGTDIRRVVFSITSQATGITTALNTELNSPWNCTLNTKSFADGNYTLRAVAFDAANRTATATRDIVIRKSTSTGGTSGGSTGGGTTTPTAQFVAPASGGVLKGDSTGKVAGLPACGVSGTNIAKVVFFMNDAQTNYDMNGTNGWGCYLDTKNYAPGTHRLKAVVTNTAGQSTTIEQPVVIEGATTPSIAQFVAPSSGGVLKGDSTGKVAGLPNCGVSGSNISKVVFFMDDVQTNYDMNGSNGWGCYLNTNNYTPGTHTLKAVVTTTTGQTGTISQAVTIEGATTPPPNALPSVTITAPAAGTVSDSVSCAATASDTDGTINSVQFSLTNAGGTKTNLQNDTTSPYQCSFDSKSFANGTYTLTADATDNSGGKKSDSRTITISNTDDTASGGTPIATGDIMTMATADRLFSTQPDVVVDILGSTVWLTSIPETGRHGTLLTNNETLRFGKEDDPVVTGRKAMTFQLVKSDPNTGGSKRTEIAFPRELEMNKTYWLAVSILVEDWGTLSTSDNALFGFQVHSGTKLDLSPQLTLLTTKDGRSFRVMTRWSTSSTPSMSNSVSAYYAERPIPFGQWMDFVVKFKQNVQGQGFAQVYMNGELIANHQGNLGYSTPGFLDFVKWGYYNWTSSFAENSPRKVRLRSPMIVADPTGSKYKEADFRAVLGPRSGTLGQ